MYYLARIYLGKTLQFKSAGTIVPLASQFPVVLKDKKGLCSSQECVQGAFSEGLWNQYLKRDVVVELLFFCFVLFCFKYKNVK